MTSSHQSLVDTRDIERDLLCLRLLMEKTKGKGSFWHPYISFLPQVYSDPYFWSSVDLQLLGGTPLGRAVEAHRPGLERILHWSRRLNDLYPGSLSSWAASCEGVRWARSTIWSRSFTIHRLKGVREPTIALIPVLDMIDHDPQMEVVWDTGPEGDEDFQWRALCQEFKAGQELKNSYGSSKSNDELILAYGFAIEGNPADYVSITVSTLSPHQSASCDEEECQMKAEENQRAIVLHHHSLTREIRLSLLLTEDSFERHLFCIAIHLLTPQELCCIYSQVLVEPQTAPSGSQRDQENGNGDRGCMASSSHSLNESAMHVVPLSRKIKPSSSQPLPSLAPHQRLRAALTFRDQLLSLLRDLPIDFDSQSPHALIAKTYVEGRRVILESHLERLRLEMSRLLMAAEGRVDCRVITGKEGTADCTSPYRTALDHIEEYSSWLSQSVSLKCCMKECLTLPLAAQGSDVPLGCQLGPSNCQPESSNCPWPSCSSSFRSLPGLKLNPHNKEDEEKTEDKAIPDGPTPCPPLPPGFTSALGLHQWVQFEDISLSWGVTIDSAEEEADGFPSGSELLSIDRDYCLIGDSTESLVLTLMTTSHSILAKIISWGDSNEAADVQQGSSWSGGLTPRERLVLHLMRMVGASPAVRFSTNDQLLDLLDDSSLGYSLREAIKDMQEKFESLPRPSEPVLFYWDDSFSLFAWASSVVLQCSIQLPSSTAIVPIICAAPKTLRGAAFSCTEDNEGFINVESTCALRSKQHLSPSSLIAVEDNDKLLMSYGPELIPWADALLRRESSIHWSSYDMSVSIADEDPQREEKMRLISALGLGLDHQIKDTRTNQIVMSVMAISGSQEELFLHPLVNKALGMDDHQLALSSEERKVLLPEILGSLPLIPSQLKQVVQDARKHTRRRLRQMETGEERSTATSQRSKMSEGTRRYLEDLAALMEKWAKVLEPAGHGDGVKPRSVKRQKKEH